MLNKKIFLDTNIVADIIDKTRLKHKEGLEFLKKIILKDYEVYISEDILSTLFYISKDKKTTLEFFKYVVMVDWNVSSFGSDILMNAIEISLEHNVDFEDILQCLCAKENSCEILITNDNKFYDCGLKIQTISEFQEI